MKDNNNRNALFYAINSNNSDNIEMINNLIINGININDNDCEGQSPLTLAVQKGQKETVKILLNNGSDVDHKVSRDGNTALHYAVTNNKPELIFLILSKKPNLNIKNKNEQTPMEIATNLSRTEVYQILAEEYNSRELLSNTQIKEDNLKEDEEINALNSFAPSNQNIQSTNMSYHNFTNMTHTNTNKINNMNYSYLNSNTSNNSNLSNLNIGINTQSNRYNSTVNSSHKKNKNNKLQKLNYLQVRRMLFEQSGRSIKDKTFKFPFGQYESNSNNIEIPFNFHTNSDGKIGSNSSKFGKGTQLHTFISKIRKL